MKNVVITGATSMIGLALLKKYLQEDTHILAIIRPNSSKRSLIPISPSISIVESDSSQLSSLVCDRKYDIFYHLAWQYTDHDTRNNPLLQNNNITDTLHAIELAKQLACTCFIGTGSQAEYGLQNTILTPNTPVQPDSAYGLAKYTAGKLGMILAENIGIRYIWTRIFSVYGPNDGDTTLISSSLRALLSNNSIDLTPCEQKWDYLYIDDCANALYLLAQKGKDQTVYCIGSGTALPLKEYIESIGSLLNKQEYLRIGARPYSKNQIQILQADIGSLTKDTGFTPTISFEEGIQRTLDYIKRTS